MKAFMEKVTIEADEALARVYPQRWPATVVVNVGGKVMEKTVIDALGDPGAPLDERALMDKAKRVLDPVIGEAERVSWIKAAGNAEAEGWSLLKTLME
jgi:2-methylcitrate dehydratase PrpD